MPSRHATQAGAPCWIDLLSSDTTRAKAFYGQLFGWEADDMGPDYGNYITFSKDGAPVGGCMANDGQSGAPDAWNIYLTSADAGATVAAASAHGGQVVVPVMPVMDLGSMAIVSDVGHAGIGVWQAGQFAGFETLGQPGLPAWFELLTRDYDASVAFYRDVFGWEAETMSDTPEFRYTVLKQGDDQLAGIMDASGFLPEGTRPSWSVYLQVLDADDAINQASLLGGSVVRAPEDTPYGRLAELADPTGAGFKVMARPELG